MTLPIFFASLAVAILAPVLALAYLRPILVRVLRGLCDAEGTAEFWIRCATLLSTSGTMLLVMIAGEFGDSVTLVDALRHVLFLTMTGVFASVAIISRNVWDQARPARSAPTVTRAPGAGFTPAAK